MEGKEAGLMLLFYLGRRDEDRESKSALLGGGLPPNHLSAGKPVYRFPDPGGVRASFVAFEEVVDARDGDGPFFFKGIVTIPGVMQ